MRQHTKKHSIFKCVFIHFTNICCIPSTERGPGDTMVSKRRKQEHRPLGASSLAGKIDTEQVINAAEFCEEV